MTHDNSCKEKKYDGMRACVSGKTNAQNKFCDTDCSGRSVVRLALWLASHNPGWPAAMMGLSGTVWVVTDWGPPAGPPKKKIYMDKRAFRRTTFVVWMGFEIWRRIEVICSIGERGGSIVGADDDKEGWLAGWLRNYRGLSVRSMWTALHRFYYSKIKLICALFYFYSSCFDKLAVITANTTVNLNGVAEHNQWLGTDR